MVSRIAPLGLLALALMSASGCHEEPRTYSTRTASGQIVFSDDFSGDALGAVWNATEPAGVTVQDGLLRLRELRNHPVWLTQPLPDDVRIDVDAWATTEEGDIKVELAGDGRSVARSLNYVSTGYVVIFGGWNNSLNAICRGSEHGRDRVTSSEPKVEPGQRYRLSITRIGGEIRWEVDGVEVLVLEDEKPLSGDAHAHFALSGWEAETHFDNLVIEAL